MISFSIDQYIRKFSYMIHPYRFIQKITCSTRFLVLIQWSISVVFFCMTINLLSTQTVMAQTTVEPSKKVYPQKTITPSSPSIPAAGTPSNSSQIKPIKNQTTKKEKGSLEGVPLPKKRGFWAMFFFWSGGVLCMY